MGSPDCNLINSLWGSLFSGYFKKPSFRGVDDL
jgi:hypothetical protein